MRKTVLFLMIALSVFTSCHFIGGKKVTGNGQLASEERSMGDFDAVEVSGGMDVVLIPGGNYSVKVEADQNLIEYIRTERRGERLNISTRKGYNLRPRAGMKVYVTLPRLRDLDVTGSGKVTTQSRIAGSERLKATVTGSGDVIMEVDVPEVASEVTGSGTIVLNGNTRNFEAEINGSGDIRCRNLLSERTKVEINGSGNAQVFASKRLDIEINGSGNVEYGGDPSVHQNINGSGDIRKVQ